MKITITINTDNAAFEDESGSEVARILRELCNEIEGRDILGNDDGTNLRDINGNRVGVMEVAP